MLAQSKRDARDWFTFAQKVEMHLDSEELHLHSQLFLILSDKDAK